MFSFTRDVPDNRLVHIHISAYSRCGLGYMYFTLGEMLTDDVSIKTQYSTLADISEKITRTFSITKI